MRCSLLSIVLASAVLAGCAGRPPHHAMIEQAYFKCEKCRSIEGGIYGKGPFIKLHSDDAPSCAHHWQRISRDEFKRLGEEWRRADWSEAIEFWREQAVGAV